MPPSADPSPPAEAAYRAALARDPGDADAWYGLGRLHGQAGRHAAAADFFAAAVRLQPAAAGWVNLGAALEHLGRPEEAADAYARAVPLVPTDPLPLGRRADLLRRLGRPAAALPLYRRAVDLRPNSAPARHALAGLWADLGRYREAAAEFKRAAALDPASAAWHGDSLHLLLYDPDQTAEGLSAAAREWAARHADPLTRHAPPPGNDPDPDRLLRVGYVSGDFRDHPVGRLMAPILAHLNRGAFTVVCYDHGAKSDATTGRLRACPATIWRETRALSDAALADLVRADRIDVLVDLGGHMGGNRLGVFARRPAPVQVTHFNYPATTGLSAMDWRLTDPLSEPAGVGDAHATERLYRLPRVAWCYDPGEDVPAVGPLPALTRGHVTFAALNKPLKHSAPAVALWAEVLKAVPGSRLLLQGFADPGENAPLAEPFARHGVADRLLFAPRRPRRAYLDLFNRADVALDPFPYNGGVTSGDGLYMGVPPVALAGDAYRSRQGLMLLANVGLGELVADTPDRYVRVAAELAGDLPRLAALRAGLRGRMRASPLMDGSTFAGDLGAAYRAMWRAWCARPPAASPTTPIDP